MKNKKLYIGTWKMPGLPVTDDIGIYVYDVSEEGELTLVQKCSTGFMTSMLCISGDQKYLYSVDECRDSFGKMNAGASVVSFSIDPDSGKLKMMNHQNSVGHFPAFVSTDGEYLFTANHGANETVSRFVKTEDGSYSLETVYDQGSVVMFPLDSDGTILPAVYVEPIECRTKTSWIPAQGIHPHCVVPDPSGNYLLVSDTGGDTLYVFSIDKTNHKLIRGDNAIFETHPEAAPRLIRFHQDGFTFFVCNEFKSTACMYSFNPQTGKISLLDSVNTILDGEDVTKNMTADIQIHPNGRFVYISNRSVLSFEPDVEGAPQSSIAAFEIDTKEQKLRRIGHTYTPGQNPRGIAIDPNGRFLFAACSDDGMIVRYEIDTATGQLINPLKVVDVPGPASLTFLA